jgi:CheY-like chemotaxis protein
VKCVLQPAQRPFSARLVEPIGLGCDDVQPRERTQEPRPELAELLGIELARAGPSRHAPIVVVSVGPPMEAQSLALVVDDDPSLRTLVRVNLELEGFSVREAGSVGDAEAAVARERPDVVLLDVHLGGEESTPLLVRLRAQGIPVALVTGSVDVNDYRDAADAILAKPFVPENLVNVARRLARVGR